MSTYPADADLPQSGSISARWLMDETSGDAVDEVGSYDLTDTNTVTSGTGFSNVDSGYSYDKARLFTAANSEYFTASDNAVVSPTGAFSISFFAKLVTTGTQQECIYKYDFGTTGENSFRMRIGSGDNIDLIVDQTGAGTTQSSVSSSSTIGTSDFSLVTAVFEPSTRVTIYFDGVQDAENTTSIVSGCFDGNLPFRVGTHSQVGAENKFLGGYMNDLIFWKGAALTDAEVLSLYNLYTTTPAAANNNAYAYFI